MLQESTTTPQQNNEEEENRIIRTNEEIYRIIRNQHPQLQTHMKRGECDMRKSYPRKSNRVVDKQTHKR